MASDCPPAIRPLHFLEQYSAARHHLGIYYCVVTTARYEQVGQRDETKPHPVYNALVTLIRRHPMLRVGIADDDTKKPFFCHIPKVDLRNLVEFKIIKCSSPQDYNLKLAELQASRHGQPFPDRTKIPPWRLIVVRPETEGVLSSHSEDFMFAFHHSLLDGHSSKLFHEQLVALLNYPSCSVDAEAAQTYEIEFMAKPDLPPPREEVIPSNLTAGYIASVLWKEKGPKWLQPSSEPIWAGRDVDFSLPFVTRILPVDIPPETLATILRACRKNSTTLTSLLHALILASLARRLDGREAPAFKSTTPINYRLLKMENVQKAWSEDTLTTAVTASIEKHPALAVAAFRASGSDLDALIWANAQRIGKDLEERRSTLPVNDDVMLLQYAGSMVDFFKQKDGRRRETSWEISNIGVAKGVPFENEDHRSWRITRAIFSNSAMVAGAAMSVNVASVAGNSLTMSIVWQEGVVPEEIMGGLTSDLPEFIARYAAEGTFIRKPAA